MSLHQIPSINRQMLRRAQKNVLLEKLLKNIPEEDKEETETKKSDFNRFVSESGVRYDFSGELNKLLQKKLEESFESNSPFSGISHNYFGNSFNPWDFLK